MTPAPVSSAWRSVGSGALQWRRTVSGGPEPVAFFSGAVLALDGDGQSMWFFQVEAGKILTQITRAAEPARRGGRWNAFVIGRGGHMWVTGGEDGERKGTVDIIDPEGS